MAWFRVYDDILDNPKIALLADYPFRLLVNLWAIARRQGGTVPSDLKLVAFMLHMPPLGNMGKLRDGLQVLQSDGLIDIVDGGYRPHDWDEHQFDFDNGAARVKRHRAKRAAAGLPPQWQPSKEFRTSIYERDGFKCVYCESETDLTLDHKIPEMRGGTHGADNIVTACRSCNASKRDLTYDEFVKRRTGNDDSNVTVTPPEDRIQKAEQNRTEDKRAPQADAPPKPEPPKPKSSRSKPKTQLPEAFPDEKALDDARQFWGAHGRPDLVPRLDDEAAQFRDHVAKNATMSADWRASWRTWYRNTPQFVKLQNSNQSRISAHDKGTRGAALWLAGQADAGDGTGASGSPLPANGHGRTEVGLSVRRVLERLPAPDGGPVPGSVPGVPGKLQ